MTVRNITALVCLALLVTACDLATSARTDPNSPAARYHPALLLKTRMAAASTGVLELLPPKGYHKAAETPDRLFTQGSVTAARDGFVVTFRNAKPGDMAWVEVYYCPESNAGLCTFRPIEVSFVRNGTADLQFKLPDPAG